MKKILLLTTALAFFSIVKAQTKTGAPPQRTTDPVLTRPIAGGLLPIKSGVAAAAATDKTAGTGTVPLRSTDQAGPRKTSTQTPVVRPAGNSQPLPSDSAVRKIDKGN